MLAPVGLFWLLGCGVAGALPSAPPAVTPSSCSEAPAAPQAPAEQRSFELHVRPLPAESGSAIAVREVLIAPEAELSMLRAPAGLHQALEVRVGVERPGCDPATGAPPHTSRVLRVQPDAALPLGAGTAPWLRLQLDYQLEARASGLVSEQRFFAQGRQLFFLPASGPEAPTPTSIAIDAAAYGPDGRAVSSIGLGVERRARMSRRAIDEAVFAAGYLGSAMFDAPEGHDEMAWFGSPLFDPRPLAAEIASFRSAVRERLNDPSDALLTLILNVEGTLATFDVRRAPASVVVRVPAGQVLSAQLRLAILHQVLKEWIGGRLTLTDENGAEAVWFTEGLCRYLARQLAFDFGLISALEHLEELNTLVAIQSVLTEPRHAAACAAEAALPGGAFSGCRDLLALARGALLAGELDRALDARGKSLTALLGAKLRDRARLTPETWASTLELDAGPPVRALLADFARGAAVMPPSTAFGPCFTRSTRRLAQSELGFDYQSGDPTSAAGRWRVTRVPERSPAGLAGLRVDAAIDAIDFAPYAAERPIRLRLADGQQLEYQPDSHALPGSAWKRVAGVPDRDCSRR